MQSRVIPGRGTSCTIGQVEGGRYLTHFLVVGILVEQLNGLYEKFM